MWDCLAKPDADAGPHTNPYAYASTNGYAFPHSPTDHPARFDGNTHQHSHLHANPATYPDAYSVANAHRRSYIYLRADVDADADARADPSVYTHSDT